MLAIQNEERRLFHSKNQLHMKKLFMDTLSKKTDSPSLPAAKPEVTFASFVQTAMKNENTRILLGELLQFFEMQLKDNFECQ